MQELSKLNSKFSENLNTFLKEAQDAFFDIDLRARAIAAIGQIATEENQLQPSQTEILLIFDEVFSDIILSIYFTACSLNKPAQSVLRRAFELGIAIVYLWDLPHIFWAWKAHDFDLNFNDMAEHLSKDCYKSYLTSLNSRFHDNTLFDYSEAKRIYRTLSNTIHGKISTHESNLPDRFSYNCEHWRLNLDLVVHVEKTLLKLFKIRFSEYFEKMAKKIPAINTLI